MTAVHLEGLHLNDAETPSEHTAITGCRKERDTDSEIEYAVWDVSDENREWIEVHLGKTVCLRDSEGGKVFGALNELSEAKAGSEARITAQKVDFSEAV